MTLGVLVRRLNQVPWIEGTVRAALARGHRVVLLLDDRDAGGPKGVLAPTAGRLPARFRAWAEVRRWPAPTARLDAVLVPGPIAWRAEELPKARIRAGLQTSWSDVMHLAAAAADQWSAVYAWSSSWARFWTDSHGTAGAPTTFVPVSHPLAEHLGWLDRDAIRAQYGIPPDRRVVLFLPFPFGAHEQPWRLRWGYRVAPWGDRAVVRAVRDYCDRQNATLVVMDRYKVDTPGYTKRAADVFVEHADPAEPTVLKLLSVSQLMVHHLSAAVAEAAAAGVTALSVKPKHWTAYERRGDIPSFSTTTEPWETDSFYAWAGMCYLAQPHVAGALLRAGAWVIPPPGRQSYVDLFLGGEPFNAGARSLDDLEKRV